MSISCWQVLQITRNAAIANPVARDALIQVGMLHELMHLSTSTPVLPHLCS
jgi:hypothetical protein